MKSTVESAWRQRAAGQRHVNRDKDCLGLAPIVNPTGMAWVFDDRPRGIDPRTKKAPVESHGDNWRACEPFARDARTEARCLKGGDVRGGKDLAAEKEAKAERKKRAILDRLVQDCEKTLERRPRLRGGAGTLSETV